MATKAIKFGNSTTTYLPVTDATLVQMKVDNVVKSVQDVIIEDEEITAAAWNDANQRLSNLEDDTHEPTGIASGILSPANKNITNNSSTGQQEVITSINVNSDGHVLSYTKTSIYSTDTVTTNTDHTSSIVASGTKGTANVVSDVVITSSTSGSNTAYTVKMTYTTALTNLNGQSKDFGKVQTLTDETGTGAGTTTKGTMNADAIKDVLQVKGGNKWITTGVSNTTAETTSDNDILTINHSQIGAVTPITSANIVTASASGATAAWSIDVVKGVTITYDNAGHVTGLSVTSGKIPGNPNVTSKLLVAKTAAGTSSVTTASTDVTYINHLEGTSVNSTVGIKPDNTWIDISYNPINSYIYVKHKSKTAGTTATATGSVNIGGTFTEISYVFDAAGHRDKQITKTWTITAPTTQTVLKTLTLAPTKYVEIKSDAEDLDSTWLATIGSGSTSYHMTSCNSSFTHSTGTSTAYVKTA